MDGFMELQGLKRGFFELEIRRQWEILTIGIKNALGVGVRSGIFPGDKQEWIPWKRLFYGRN